MPTHVRLFKRSILQQTNIAIFQIPTNPCVLYTYASNNAYSGVLCQPLVTTKILGQLHIFQVHLQHKTKVGVQQKEAYTVLKSVQRFDNYLSGAKCTLQCHHKPLEPFLTRGMKITKLDRWSNDASGV